MTSARFCRALAQHKEFPSKSTQRKPLCADRSKFSRRFLTNERHRLGRTMLCSCKCGRRRVQRREPPLSLSSPAAAHLPRRRRAAVAACCAGRGHRSPKQTRAAAALVRREEKALTFTPLLHCTLQLHCCDHTSRRRRQPESDAHNEGAQHTQKHDAPRSLGEKRGACCRCQVSATKLPRSAKTAAAALGRRDQKKRAEKKEPLLLLLLLLRLLLLPLKLEIRGSVVIQSKMYM